MPPKLCRVQLGAKIFACARALLYIVISNVIPSCHIVNRQQADRDHVTNFESNSFSFNSARACCSERGWHKQANIALSFDKVVQVFVCSQSEVGRREGRLWIKFERPAGDCTESNNLLPEQAFPR